MTQATFKINPAKFGDWWKANRAILYRIANLWFIGKKLKAVLLTLLATIDAIVLGQTIVVETSQNSQQGSLFASASYNPEVGSVSAVKPVRALSELLKDAPVFEPSNI